jgi:phosphoglycolate phosphatase
MGVVTNKAYYAAKELIDSHFDGYFDLVLGDQMNIGLERKPNPNIIFYAMDKLNVSDKNKVLYIGDSDVDIMTAKNSGMPCISVLWGFRDKDFLVRHGGSVFVNSPEEIF